MTAHPSPDAPLPLLAAAFFLPPRLTPARVRRDRRYRALERGRFIAWFLFLPLLVYAVLVVSPFLQAFYYSLTDWTGTSPEYRLVGLENYRRLWHDEDFWSATRNSLLLLAAAPLITLGLGLFLAGMLHAGGRRRRGRAFTGVAGARLYAVVLFFPQVLSLAVVAVIFDRVLSPRGGILNEGLGAVGLGSWRQDDWLGGDLALWCVLGVLCWSFTGFYVVLFSAAMGAVPGEIHEAALLDGAGRGTAFFRITLPLIGETVRTGWIYMGIQALDCFALVAVMVPAHGMDVLPTYLYETAMRDSQAGYATAIGVVLFLVTLLFTALLLRLGPRERHEY
ncbi:sugar ABC transporter permease [Streptomyces sp. DSM 44917]|uniref:Sugar ABC transporter permease n=1 Tax=Streptomyces boetiae TaxID=3075541 RepID=A0ABU2L2C1_9ACTN|nr:sugar ABC transporter permease [Streptomyces sp. DSM 44917]MDT0305701.1 sugar ABC transporter permease [Streptomyces sp. DSM 44917]